MLLRNLTWKLVKLNFSVYSKNILNVHGGPVWVVFYTKLTKVSYFVSELPQITGSWVKQPWLAVAK